MSVSFNKETKDQSLGIEKDRDLCPLLVYPHDLVTFSPNIVDKLTFTTNKPFVLLHVPVICNVLERPLITSVNNKYAVPKSRITNYSPRDKLDNENYVPLPSNVNIVSSLAGWLRLLKETK